MQTTHTDPDQRRLAAAFTAHLRACSDEPTRSLALDSDEQYQLAAELANVARRVGWAPPKP